MIPSTWEEAFELIGRRFKEVREQHGGQAIGVFGSNRTTNEENYLLQKFARVVLQTNNIDHHRTADFPAFAAAVAGKPEATATMRDVFQCACDIADRKRSHGTTSAAGLPDSEQCALAPGKVVCGEFARDKTGAPGGWILADSYWSGRTIAAF